MGLGESFSYLCSELNNIDSRLFVRKNQTMTIASPCKLICRYDVDGTCVGCRRTKTEIMNWINYDDQQKLAVWKKIRMRRNGVNADEDGRK